MERMDCCRGLRRALAAGMVLTGALALVAGSGTAPTAAAGATKTFTKVTATATKPDAEGRQVVTVTLTTEKPWYVYANPVLNKEIEDARTTVKIASSTGKLEDVKIEYPPGKVKKDKDLGTFKVYEDRVSITGKVRRARGDTSPLDVSVRYMNCNGNQCLMMKTVKLTVP